MLEPLSFTGFLNHFYRYVLPARPLDEINLIISALSATHENFELRWRLLEITEGEELINLKPEQLAYIYCYAVLHNNEEKTLYIRALVKTANSQNIIKWYSKGWNLLLWWVLAYDVKTGTFNTDTLLMQLTECIKRDEFISTSLQTFFCVLKKREHIIDYRIENAISLIKAIMAKNYPFNPSLPLYWVFSFPIQDSRTIQLGLELLETGVKPMDILFHASPPVNHNYDLLNHCVELSVLDNTFPRESEFQYDARRYSELCRWENVLSYIPAALYERDEGEDCVSAIRMGYRRALVRCLTRGLLYAESTAQMLDDLYAYWMQGVITCAAVLKFLAKIAEKDAHDCLTVSSVNMQRIAVDGLTLALGPDVANLPKWIFVLSEVCVKHRLYFLADILYSFFKIIKDCSSLRESEIARIASNSEQYCQDKSYHHSFGNRLSVSVVRLPAVLIIISTILTLTESDLCLQDWLNTNFGRLVVLQYTSHCLYMPSESFINELAMKVLSVLLGHDPRRIGKWQLELLYKQLSDAMLLDQVVTDAYQEMQDNLTDKPVKVRTVEKYFSPLTGEDILRSIFNTFSTHDLLTTRLHAVNHLFKRVVHALLRQRLVAAHETNDFSEVVNENDFNHLFYIACQSADIIFQSICSMIFFNEVKEKLKCFPVSIAAAVGQVEVMDRLHSNGLDLTESGEKVATPIEEALKYGHVNVLVYLLSKKVSITGDFGRFLKALEILYVKDFQTGRISKERYQQWLFIIEQMATKLSQLQRMWNTFLVKAALMNEDWRMLAILWRANKNPKGIPFSRYIRNHFGGELVENAVLVIHGQKFAISANAPEWWHEQQQANFQQIQLKKTQLLNLCDALLQELEALPIRSESLSGLLGNFAPLMEDVEMKKKLIENLRGLIESLKNNSKDIISAVAEFSSAISMYRSQLKNKRYLEQINNFFDIKKGCVGNKIEEQIEKKLEKYSSDVLASREIISQVAISH